MNTQDFDYGNEYSNTKRVSYAGYQYASDQDTEKTYMRPIIRRIKRDHDNSVSFTPQARYGEPTHSPTESNEEHHNFSNKYQMFESSFRNTRVRERAPLAPRMWDTHPAQRQTAAANDPQDPQDLYDNDVALQPLAANLQELAIIEDLLSLLMGFSGRYISFRYGMQAKVWQKDVTVNEGLLAPEWMNPTLRMMADKIMPLVLMHKRIKYFIVTYAQRQAGLVNQALCAAISTVMRDFYTQVTTLENLVRTSTETEPYTLQKLWCHIYPSMRTFERLVHLISAIQEKDLPLPTQPVVEKSQLEDDGFMSSVGDGMAPDEEVADFVDNGMPNSEPESVDYEDEVVDEVYDLEIFPEERFVVRGGFTLNVISDMIRMRGGDQSTRQLYEFLLTKASVPFIKMLEHWLSTGELESNRLDMAGEFMVVRDSDAVGVRVFLDTDGAEDFGGKSILPISNGLSFMSVPDLTPEYLRPFSEKIVRTGEYLNTLRSYGIDLRTLEHKSSPAGAFSAGSDSSGGLDTLGCSLDGLLNPQTLMREIDQAYLRANQALLDILFKDGKMMTYLGAVKHYLLFEKSDFLTHFLDLAKVEISREPKDMSANRLQSFLDLALLNPASVSHDDPLKDIVKVTLESVDLIDTLKMISLAELKKPTEMPSTTHRPIRETYAAGATFLGTSILSDNFLSGDVSLGLQLQIPFPLDIVLDRPTMNKYRAMSRLLLMLKQTEQNLVASWMTNLKLDDPRFILPGSSAASSSARAQNIKDVKTEAQLRALFLNIHTMRHRILICIQQILYYCFWDVIEPQWAKMTELMKKATTVDELSGIHKKYLDIMFQQFGLTAGKLPKTIVELLKRSNKFISLVNNMVSTKSVLFRRSARREVEDESTDLVRKRQQEQQDTLASFMVKLREANDDWSQQLRTMVRALNHYARKFDESYLTLAVRLDCNQGENAFNGS